MFFFFSCIYFLYLLLLGSGSQGVVCIRTGKVNLSFLQFVWCTNQTTMPTTPPPSPHPPKQTKSDGSSPFFCETLPLHLIKGLHLLPITICCRNTLPFTISRCCGNYSPPLPRLLHLWHNSAVVVIELKSCYRTCLEMGVVQPVTVIALMDLLHQYECVHYLPRVLKKAKTSFGPLALPSGGIAFFPPVI